MSATENKTVTRGSPESPPQVKGLFKGLYFTLRTMLTPTQVVQYPHVKEEPVARARGVIGLQAENCTVCMLCCRECPDWCIYIEGHKEKRPPKREGAKPRTVQVLDRFDIDFGLCMFCGICVEVCPFDALHWSPEYEYAELELRSLLHDKERLGYWDDLRGATVPYEAGSEVKAKGKK